MCDYLSTASVPTRSGRYTPAICHEVTARLRANARNACFSSHIDRSVAEGGERERADRGNAPNRPRVEEEKDQRRRGGGEDNTPKRESAEESRDRNRGPGPLKDSGVLGVCVAYRRRMPRWKKDEARRMRNDPTEGERVMWQRLRRKQLGFRFHRQSPMLGYIADFWCPSRHLVVEIDGSSHDYRVAYDAERDAIFGEKGIRVVRINSLYAVHHTDDAVAMVMLALGPQQQEEVSAT